MDSGIDLPSKEKLSRASDSNPAMVLISWDFPLPLSP
jgi:hypothetical protein